VPTFPVAPVTTMRVLIGPPRPAPDLPGRDSRQVLAAIKADDELRALPVVVLSSSHSDTDVVTSYQVHANAYVTKPLEAAAFSAAVREIGVFFSVIVKLPR
jgi:CheY-like chemotaxis protein